MKELLKYITALLLLLPMGVAVLLAYGGALIARLVMQIMGVWEDI